MGLQWISHFFFFVAFPCRVFILPVFFAFSFFFILRFSSFSFFFGGGGGRFSFFCFFFHFFGSACLPVRFFSFFLVSLFFSSSFFVLFFLRLILHICRQLLSMVPQLSATGKTAKNCKKGEFRSDPVYTDPVRNFPCHPWIAMWYWVPGGNRHFKPQQATGLLDLEGDQSSYQHQLKAYIFWMRLFYLQLRSFCLRFVFFTYGGGTVSKKTKPNFLDKGNRK